MALAFDATYYLTQNPDVLAAAAAGLTTAEAHFNNFGWKELRNPNAVFDTSDYLTANADVLAAQINPLAHFLAYGAAESRAPSTAYATIAANFGSANYLSANPDVQAAVTAGTFTSAYQHWVLYGQYETARPVAQLADGTLVSTIVSTGTTGTPGSTFTLTSGSDVITTTQGSLNSGATQITARPGANDDTFLAEADGLFAAGDVLDGGAGTDTLNARYSTADANTAISVGRMSNVEKAYIRADLNTNGTAANEVSNISVGEWTGLTELWADRVNSGHATASTLTFDNIKLGTTLGVKGAAAANASNVIFNYTASEVTGSSDSATLSLDGATAATVTVAGIETMNVVSGGSSANTLAALTTAAATTLNVSGAQNLTITGALSNTVKTVDASTATGNVNVQLGTITGTVKATGGAGNDKIGLGTLVATANTTINGGAGNNTLKVDEVTANLAAQIVNLTNTNVTNIKTLELGGNVAGIDLNNVKFTVSDFVFSDTANAQAIAITNHSSANTYTLTGGAATDETSFTITTLKESNTLSNVLNLTLTNSDVSSIDGSTANNNIETMNITSNKTSAGVLEGDANTLGTVTVNAGGTINLTGNADTTLTLGASSTLDASSSAFTAKVTVVGSANNDVIKGGALADTITGAAGIDTLTGNGGADTFKISAAAASGADRNTITDFTVGTGGDVFNFNSGVNALDGSNGFTSSAALQAHAAGGNATMNGAAEVLVITSGTIADITAANSLDGTNLLTAVGGSITGAAGAGAGANDYLFAIGIAGGGTAIYAGDSGDGDNTFVAGDITLVGILQNVSVTALTFDNFANAA